MSNLNPKHDARAAQLRYISDEKPGILRIRAGKGFRYLTSKGRPIRNKSELKRIQRLAIPPAWTQVWICPLANGHLQATGRDARGRKQYRYHDDWQAVRDETKFTRMIPFGRALPKIRVRLRQDLARPGLPREKVLATIVRLLETTSIRVGNEEYARRNSSFGLTTFRNRHVKVRRSGVRFEFRGKSGRDHAIDMNDPGLARVIKKCRELPGVMLFQYLDEAGQRQAVDSGDVNDYLREITGEEFSAKDFRTWAGTTLAAAELRADNHAPTKRRMAQVIKRVALQLGNRPAACRKYYIHPAVLESYLAGTLGRAITGTSRRALLSFLRRHSKSGNFSQARQP